MTSKIPSSLTLILAVLFTTTVSFAAPRIDSVSPATGAIGQDLTMTISGSGFDENTRVSISLDTMNRGFIAGSLPTPYDIYDVAVAGQYAYMVGEGGRFKTVSIRNPANPVIVGSLLVGDLEKIAVSGGIAYVMDSDFLKLIDISDPLHPALISSLSFPRWNRDITVSGHYVYLTNSATGLNIIDVSDPQNPSVQGSLAITYWVREVCVSGSLAFVATRNNQGVRIIDVSDPAQPLAVGSIATSGPASSVAVSGTKAYVADDEFRVIDISNPAQPTLMSTLHQAVGNSTVTVSGNTAYVVDEHEGLFILDISNPSVPAVAGQVDTPGRASGLFLVDNTAYVADGVLGLQVIDVNEPEVLPATDTYTAQDFAIAAGVSGTTAYLFDYTGLLVLDAQNPLAPRLLGTLPMPSPPYGAALAFSGPTVYVAASNSLQVIDVSNPAQPVLTGSMNFDDDLIPPVNLSMTQINVSGSTLFIISSREVYSRETSTYVWELHVVDVSDPQVPLLKSTAQLPGEPMAVDLNRQIIYVPEYPATVSAVDISEPAAPVILEQMSIPQPAWAEVDLIQDVAAVGETIYIATSRTIYQFDGSGPGAPVIIATLPVITDEAGCPFGANSFLDNTLVGDGIISFADCRNNLHAIDVSSQGQMTVIGTTTMAADRITTLAINGEFAYVTAEDNLSIRPLTREIFPVHLNNSSTIAVTIPSPVVAGAYNVRVFNDSDDEVLLRGVHFSPADIDEEQEIPLVGDWNGDNRDRIGLFSGHTFFLDTNNDGHPDESIGFGRDGDIPVIGDWDGDGADGIGVFRPSTRKFYLDSDRDGLTDISGTIGRIGDMPVVGDWDHDGRDDIGVYRPSQRRYYLDYNRDGIHDRAVSIGRLGDDFLVGDWNGDGIDSIGVFRPDNARFYLDDDEDGIHDHAQFFGRRDDIPLAGDWNGNGVTDIGIYRSTTGYFHLDYDFDGTADDIILYEAD
ncbi:MAG: IPT/TIG domain-containing protein [Deltaproteobacteria bacterium]|nr:IPT/TIG domain-containing protein [Deltaproteobacteria bacterium]